MVVQSLRRAARRLIVFQVFVLLVVAGGYLLLQGSSGALAAGYGGLASLLMSCLLALGVARADNETRTTMASLYVSAAVRFILLAVVFGLGLAVLGLEPLAMIVGFLVVQAVYLMTFSEAGKQQ